MRILVDTNVVIRALADSELPREWRTILLDPNRQIALSSISLAEIASKIAIGKLPEPPGPLALVPASLGFDELPFEARHAERLRRLPLHHRDPFDRMLIAQAIVEDLAIMTTDRMFESYPVRLVPLA